MKLDWATNWYHVHSHGKGLPASELLIEATSQGLQARFPATSQGLQVRFPLRERIARDRAFN